MTQPAVPGAPPASTTPARPISPNPAAAVSADAGQQETERGVPAKVVPFQ